MGCCVLFAFLDPDFSKNVLYFCIVHVVTCVDSMFCPLMLANWERALFCFYYTKHCTVVSVPYPSFTVN